LSPSVANEVAYHYVSCDAVLCFPVQGNYCCHPCFPVSLRTKALFGPFFKAVTSLIETARFPEPGRIRLYGNEGSDGKNWNRKSKKGHD